jgi:hypothetical protein
MTDLMCPARLTCLHPGASDPSGGLVAELRAARVIRVYAGPVVAAEGAALAGALGVAHEVLPALDGCGAAPLDAWLLDGDLDQQAGDGETGDAVLARIAGALATIADQHRGQAAAVLSTAGPLTLALPALCTGLSPATAHAHPLPPWTTVHIEYDSDGWHHLKGWPAASGGDVSRLCV